MGILVQNDWRHKAIFNVILVMLAGMFVSRALLSTGLALFVILTVVHPRFVSQLRTFIQSPLLLSISLLFFIPFVSGIWSDNKEEWIKVLVVKLPFLLLPIAFAGTWQFRENEWRRFGYCFIFFTILACGWSFFQYFTDAKLINESYLRAKTIPTLLDNDHVRFSWVVYLAIITCIRLIEKPVGKDRRWLSGAIILMVVYLHVLSARSGLAMLYFFAVAYAIYKVKVQPRVSIMIVAGLLVILTIGWFSFPTFRNRIRYNLYDLSFVMNNEYRSGTSDGNRVASLKAGWAIVKENPATGAGAGDTWNEVSRWYDTHIEGIKQTDKLYPSNEWLVYGCIAGWPAMILFTVIIFLPLYIKNIHHRFFWIMFHITAAAGFLIETGLETQHGVFIYTFFGLWWWKWHYFKKE